MNVEVKIRKVSESAQIPQYQTTGAAAVDLHACLDEPVTLQSMERTAVPTGIAIELPEGYEAQLRGRSGLAAHHGVGLTNGIGTIDSDYRGEIKVLLINWGSEPFTIEPGMRIVQMVITQHSRAQWVEVKELGETERGAGKFGSTG